MLIDQAVSDQPLQRIVGIGFKPGLAATKAKAVSPGIHIGKYTRPAHAAETVSEQDLQVADRVLLGVVTAGIGVQLSAPLR